MTEYPAMPPVQEGLESVAPPPRSLHPLIYLLIANLAMSLLLTVLVFTFKHSVINYQVAHHHLSHDSSLTEAEQQRIFRQAANAAIWSRVAGNVVVAIVYVFLVRALLRGRRRAYLRVHWLSIAGIASLALLWINPYPFWMRAEQVLQAFLLVAILYRVTRSEVRTYFAKRKPEAQAR
ncbi:hypothetical protein ACSMXN_10755 [Jatrophihabitans sp. DSM 45814]